MYQSLKDTHYDTLMNNLGLLDSVDLIISSLRVHGFKTSDKMLPGEHSKAIFYKDGIFVKVLANPLPEDKQIMGVFLTEWEYLYALNKAGITGVPQLYGYIPDVLMVTSFCGEDNLSTYTKLSPSLLVEMVSQVYVTLCSCYEVSGWVPDDISSKNIVINQTKDMNNFYVVDFSMLSAFTYTKFAYSYISNRLNRLVDDLYNNGLIPLSSRTLAFNIIKDLPSVVQVVL